MLCIPFPVAFVVLYLILFLNYACGRFALADRRARSQVGLSLLLYLIISVLIVATWLPTLK